MATKKASKVAVKEGTKLLVNLGPLYKELKEVSEKTGVNMARIIRDAITEKLNRK